MPYLGPLFNTVEVKALAGISDAPDDSAGYTTGVSGRRRVRMAPHASRSWSGDLLNVDPADVSDLQEIYWGYRGTPLWFVSDQAAVQNVLPPPSGTRDGDTLTPTGWTPQSGTEVTLAGAVNTTRGVAPVSYVVGGAGPVWSPFVPCVPGRPLTMSCHVSAGAHVELRWGLAGGGSTPVDTSPEAPGGPLTRVSVTVPSVPGGRTVCQLVIHDATEYARPQVTYTAGPVKYVTGKGAPKVILGPITETPSLTVPDGSRNLASYRFTLTEVGDRG